jgi:glutamate synthase domain-containing protein 3
MGAFKDLDIFIHEGVLGLETEEEEREYIRLKNEIAKHLNNELKFEELSRKAQEVLEEWERYEKEVRNASQRYS